MSSEDALRSIVALRSSIPEDAFTAAGLGTLREGSGVVIDDSGLVLTIGYLIMEASEIWMTTLDRRVVPGYALGYDHVTGFGLVQALGQLELPAVPLGNSADLQLGDAVLFGDGTGRSVEAAIVAKQEFAGYWEYLLDEALFIAPAHPSWGGAGLFDAEDRLVGIGSLRLQMLQRNRPSDINMVVPIDLLKPILNDLTTRGQVNRPARPWLGIFPAESDGAVVVTSVAESGPAAKAGIKRGDIILDVRDAGVEGLADFYRKLWSSGEAGAEVPLRIVRDGRESWLRIKSADRQSFMKRPPLQ
ncbi:MAG: S1C family serine protease [Devosia sp.]